MADRSLQLVGSPQNTRTLSPVYPQEKFRSRLVDSFVEVFKGILKASIKG